MTATTPPVVSSVTALGGAGADPGPTRVTSGVAMAAAPWGFVVTNACYAWAIRDGGSDATGAEALALFGANPLLVRVGVLAGMVGCLLLIPAVLGVFRLAPASRAVRVGGSLMIAGYVCYFAVLDSSSIVVTMAALGESQPAYAAAIDANQGSGWGTWIFALFVVGNLVGTLVFAIGLLRSRAVPRWAALAILAWPPLHVFGLVAMPNEIPQVGGAVLQAVGFAGLAARRIRPTTQRP